MKILRFVIKTIFVGQSYRGKSGSDLQTTLQSIKKSPCDFASSNFQLTFNSNANLHYFIQFPEHPRNKTDKSDPGDGVEAYTLALAQDESSVFAKNIYNFIACTRESREKIPHKVMRNMRQFMNGMKNYLVKHGEKDFGFEVDKARAALNPDEFLNLDQILEGVMHQLVILPLKDYLYELFVDYYGSRGEIELIISNMKFAENKDPVAFGVKVSAFEIMNNCRLSGLPPHKIGHFYLKLLQIKKNSNQENGSFCIHF